MHNCLKERQKNPREVVLGLFLHQSRFMFLEEAATASPLSLPQNSIVTLNGVCVRARTCTLSLIVFQLHRVHAAIELFSLELEACALKTTELTGFDGKSGLTCGGMAGRREKLERELHFNFFICTKIYKCYQDMNQIFILKAC